MNRTAAIACAVPVVAWAAFGVAAESPGDSDQELIRDSCHYADVAASVQQVTEEVLLRMARSIREETGLRRLCMAGGVALNSVANARILREAGFDDV